MGDNDFEPMGATLALNKGKWESAIAEVLKDISNVSENSSTSSKKMESVWSGAFERVGHKGVDFAFSVIGGAIKGVTNAIGDVSEFLGEAVWDAAEFQTGLSEVATLGVQDMDALRTSVLGVSSAIGEDLINATNAAYNAISAGISEEDIEGFLSVAGKASVAGVTELNTAVDALTTVLNAYGLEASEAMSVSDQLFKTIQFGKTTFDELNQGLGQVVSTAAVMDVDIGEVGGALALMTQKGIKTAEAVTALNGLLSQLLSPAGGAAEKIGKIVEAAGGLDDLDLSKAVDEFAKLETEVQVGLLGSIRAVKAILSLQDGSLEQTIRDVKESTEATEEAFLKFSGTLDQEYAILKTTFSNAVIDLAQPFEEAFGEILRAVNVYFGPIADEAVAVGKEIFEGVLGVGDTAENQEWFLIQVQELFSVSEEEAKALITEQKQGLTKGIGDGLKEILGDVDSPLGGDEQKFLSEQLGLTQEDIDEIVSKRLDDVDKIRDAMAVGELPPNEQFREQVRQVFGEDMANAIEFLDEEESVVSASKSLIQKIGDRITTDLKELREDPEASFALVVAGWFEDAGEAFGPLLDSFFDSEVVLGMQEKFLEVTPILADAAADLGLEIGKALVRKIFEWSSAFLDQNAMPEWFINILTDIMSGKDIHSNTLDRPIGFLELVSGGVVGGPRNNNGTEDTTNPGSVNNNSTFSFTSNITQSPGESSQDLAQRIVELQLSGFADPGAVIGGV